MDVAYTVCPKCDKRFCVGIEYVREPSMLCHCPYCANEFAFSEGSRAPASTPQPAWRA